MVFPDHTHFLFFISVESLTPANGASNTVIKLSATEAVIRSIKDRFEGDVTSCTYARPLENLIAPCLGVGQKQKKR